MVLGRHRSIGIHLTDQGASFVELESLLGRVRVLDAGLLALDAMDTSGGRATVASGEPVSGGRRSRFAKVDDVILGLPRRAVICRFIDVPNVEDEQLAGLIAFEIERHLPFPLEEVCYSYRRVSSSGAIARVMILAAKRTDVEQALAQVERLGLIPTGVDVTSLAATAVLHHQRGLPAGQTVTLVQLDRDEATVEVFSRDALVSSRTVSLCGGMGISRDRESLVADAQQHLRIAANGYLTFTSEVLMGEGQVVNFSGQGLCVRSHEPVVAGMILQVSLLLSEWNDPLEIDAARVQWAGNGLFGLVIEKNDSDGDLDLQQYAAHATKVLEAASGDLPGRRASCELMRSRVEGYVTFSGSDGDGEGRVVELSPEGWRIASEIPVTLGTVLTIQAAFAELNDPIVVTQGRVQWTREGEFGVHVVTIEKESLTRIASYLSLACQRGAVEVNESRPVESLVDELKRVATLIDGKPGPILLHGGSDAFRQSLGEGLGRPVDQWDTTAIATDPAAFGLALRGLPRYAVSGSLLPPERRVIRKDSVMMLCWGLLAFVGCLAGLWWASNALLERRVHDQLKTEIPRVRQEALAVTALQQEASALNHRLRELEGLISVQGRSMHLLREVVMLLPPDVLLQELSFDGTKMRLRGSTTASAALLIAAFEQSAYLENAAFTAPISVQGKDRQAFEIAATIRAVPRDSVDHHEKGAL